jgi:hypothetical protein
MGLSLHLGITTRHLSALFIACIFANTTKITPGSSSVSCSRAEEVWREDFLKRYGVLNGNKGHSKNTTGNV